MSQPKRLVLALTLALLPTLACAWTPYGYGPGPDQRMPGPVDQGPGAMGPMGPMGEPMGGPMDAPMDRPMGGPRATGLRMTQSATDDAYVLDIQLTGIRPDQVKVEVRGPWLLVTQETSAETSREETFGDGRGYSRSFSYSSGRTSRRLPIPRDADPAALQRQDTADAVQIRIPRIQRAQAPGQR